MRFQTGSGSNHSNWQIFSPSPLPHAGTWRPARLISPKGKLRLRVEKPVMGTHTGPKSTAALLTKRLHEPGIGWDDSLRSPRHRAHRSAFGDLRQLLSAVCAWSPAMRSAQFSSGDSSVPWGGRTSAASPLQGELRPAL